MGKTPYIKVDYEDQAADELPDVFWREGNAPHMHKLVRAMAEPFQKVENVVGDWMEQTDLDLAGPYRLDLEGQKLNELREGLSDKDFRKVLKAKRIAITVQRSGEHGVALRKMITLLTGSEDILYEDLPGHYEIYIQYVVPVALSPMMRRKILRTMTIAMPQGVRFQISEAYTFGFGWEGDLDTRGFDLGKFATVLS